MRYVLLLKGDPGDDEDRPVGRIRNANRLLLVAALQLMRRRHQFARFVRFSLNSTTELEYHLIAARDVRVITATDFDSLTSQTVEVRKMLYGLLRHLDRVRLDPAAPKGRSAVTRS